MSQSNPNLIPPGGTIGIIGGGQLGRMTALAAANLGYRSHIFCPQEASPGRQVATTATTADYTDSAALAAFADSVDVVTFEFENIPHESVRLLAEHVPVRPHWQCLHVAQDRLREKDFLIATGAVTAAYRAVASPDELESALQEIGRPAVLKSARFGYDGKGQVKIGPETDIPAAWIEMGSDLGILEAFVDFQMEISVVLARGVDGACAAFDPVENRHKNHILDVTIAPAAISPALADEAKALAIKIANALDFVGLLAVEMFVTSDGHLLINEIAPRPHNSGHWTIDACRTSQFEQFVRAVCGLPLGSPERDFDAVMTNLIGDDVESWPELIAEEGACLHLYGKDEARAGRKMGHVTRLTPKGSTPKASS
ncbi:MAG: 5-(carboxyamino)imidazole ribonucleotide synthase [Rhodospirillaceae bacterium]|nr:5-(carboxyamino)imidazole ribonucleotide synthase [Rhodospirillaceae bacterium]